jgi:type I restriction enzyme S subunit
MSKNFNIGKVGDLGKVSMCKRILKHETSDKEEIPFYKISTFGGIPDTFISKEKYELYKSKYSYPKVGDVLISAAGTIGKTVIFDGSPSFFQDSNIVWIDNDETKVLNRFLYYYYQTKPWIATSGSTILRLYNENIRNLKIIYPDLIVQQKIAKVLSDLDAKIELNNKINAELEAMAKLIYDYWFVQFDFPISKEQAEAMGKTELEGKPYKSSGGKMVWNTELRREVPEGWEVQTLSSWIKNDKSGDWGKEEMQGNYTERVFCIRGADLNGLNGNGEVKAPERYILGKNSHKILEPHDIIVEISGGSPTQSTGRMAYITNDSLKRFDAPIICSNFCKAVTLNDEKSLYNFAFEWHKAYDNGVLFGYEGKTSGIKNLLFESFVSSYMTAVPTIELMKQFYAFMTPLESRKQKNLLENQKLAELRDWLLPMLMNGQVVSTALNNRERSER